MLTLEELDGQYLVQSETSDGGPFIVNGDGETEIRNGLTYRKDKNGFIWESAFTILENGMVRMESTLDPSHAGDDRFVKDEKGNPTKGMMTYRTELSVSNVDGQLRLSGEIKHGSEVTRLTMTKRA